jgi:hypothetical protein
MTKRLGMVIGLSTVAISVALLLFCPSYSTLQITSVKRGEVLYCAEMTEGEEFILSFVHSVNKRPVYDTIRVEGDHLLIVKSRFDSFGAGMPEASTGGMTLKVAKDGWLEWLVNRPLPEVTLFVGWVANHSIRLKGRDISLASLAEPGTLLSLRIQKASRYELWKGRCAQ